MVVVDRQRDVLPAPTSFAVALRLPPAVDLTGEQFFQFCQLNSEVRIERTADGEITVMPPTGGPSRRPQHARRRTGRALGGCRRLRRGVRLLNRVRASQWRRTGHLTWPGYCAVVWRGSPPKRSGDSCRCVPTSSSNFVRPPIAGVRRAQDAGVPGQRRASGLVDRPRPRRVAVYLADGSVQRLERPVSLSGDPVMPGFLLALDSVWEPAL